MKKQCLTLCLVVTLLVGVFSMLRTIAPEKVEGQAAIHFGLPYWDGSLPTIINLPGHKKDTISLAGQEKMEASIAAQDSSYNRESALSKRDAARKKTDYFANNYGSNSIDIGPTFSAALIPAPQLDDGLHQPSSPSPNPVSPTQPVTPTPTPTPTPKPTAPEPANPVEYSTPTEYYFASSDEQWQELWYTSSSLLYLRGSIPADCDASRFDCWQVSFSLDGEKASISGEGCADARGTALDVSFAFDYDMLSRLEEHFIEGGGNIPLTFRYYDSNGALKTTSISGAPKVALTYDSINVKLYITR